MMSRPSVSRISRAIAINIERRADAVEVGLDSRRIGPRRRAAQRAVCQCCSRQAGQIADDEQAVGERIVLRLGAAAIDIERSRSKDAVDDKQRIADRILPGGNECQAGGKCAVGAIRNAEVALPCIHGAWSQAVESAIAVRCRGGIRGHIRVTQGSPTPDQIGFAIMIEVRQVEASRSRCCQNSVWIQAGRCR